MSRCADAAFDAAVRRRRAMTPDERVEDDRLVAEHLNDPWRKAEAALEEGETDGG